MVTVVKKWGNSLGIRLPKTVAEDVEINEGTAVTIEARDWQIIPRRECAREQNGQLRA